MTITVNTADVRRNLADLVDAMKDRTREASSTSADAVVREARSRVARRTGETMEGIHAEPSRDGKGFVVLVTRVAPRQVPYWLEYGTVYMDPQPFLFASAELEDAAHYDRTRAALDAAIREEGF